mmetsp:Transcript_10287/g.29371  ORF Transcript_10287/g.29371 Transcript_10287/m.29371 type:complete len:208 (-) Transcript_10287:438-1061(-)
MTKNLVVQLVRPHLLVPPPCFFRYPDRTTSPPMPTDCTTPPPLLRVRSSALPGGRAGDGLGEASSVAPIVAAAVDFGAGVLGAEPGNCITTEPPLRAGVEPRGDGESGAGGLSFFFCCFSLDEPDAGEAASRLCLSNFPRRALLADTISKFSLVSSRFRFSTSLRTCLVLLDSISSAYSWSASTMFPRVSATRHCKETQSVSPVTLP